MWIDLLFKTVSAIFAAEKKLLVKNLQLSVDPFHKALTLTGHAALAKYAPPGHGEERFLGGESRQVKRSLQELACGGAVVEVALEPSMLARTLGAYDFHLTQAFRSKAEMELEVQRLEKAGFIGVRIYAVRAPGKEH